MGKSAPDPPPPPNYTQQAQLQGELSEEALARQTWANRPDQISPWGTVTWGSEREVDPATGKAVTKWTQTSGLDPGLEGTLREQIGIGGGRTDIAAGMMDRLGESYSDPLDYGQFRDVTDVTDPSALRGQAEQAAYLRQTNRLDPQWEQRAGDLEIRLRNRGLRPGDEAYDREMGNFERARSDAYEQARLGATAEGRLEAGQLYGQMQSQQAQSAALRQQEIAEALQQRGMPLDEINMLLAGQGVQPAAQPGYTTAGMAQTPNMLGAAQLGYNAQADAWNAQQAQQQARNQGWLNLAGAGIGALGMFSDRRLKQNVRRLGTWRGYPFYEYDYIWGTHSFGVMADEVNPDAVTIVNGFAVVDYGRVR